MTRWWQVSWKRVAVTLLIIFLAPMLLGGIGLLVMHQLRPWLVARNLSATDPGIDAVPVPLADTSVASPAGERIVRFGFSFESPWKDVVLDRTIKDFGLLSFKNGGSITLRDPLSRFDSARSLRSWALIVPGLNGESIHSDYALRRAVLWERTGQVKWWKTPGQNAKDLNLILMKVTQTVEGGAFHPVNFGVVHGFQRGDPDVAPYVVMLDLFDGADRHYEVEIITRRAGVISQAEVNGVVASIRPMAHN